jgi:FkbM family methyltransferase
VKLLKLAVQTYWGHTYLPGCIRPDGFVFDFGVNDGGFSRLVAPLCKRVIGFEPDPDWQGMLSVPRNVRVLPQALAAGIGTVRLNMNKKKCSSLHYADDDAVGIEVPAMSFEQALALEPSGRIELVKIDIEGEEIDVLNGAPQWLFDRIAQMSVEFHDFMDKSSLPGIRAVIARMENIGFVALKFSWRSYGDILFVNRRLESISWFDRAYLIGFHKYARGIARVIGRVIKQRRWR